MEPMIYFKCTACSECFMSEDIFFAHTRTWHCKILITEGQDANDSIDNNLLSYGHKPEESCGLFAIETSTEDVPDYASTSADDDLVIRQSSFSDEICLKLEPDSQINDKFPAGAVKQLTTQKNNVDIVTIEDEDVAGTGVDKHDTHTPHSLLMPQYLHQSTCQSSHRSNVNIRSPKLPPFFGHLKMKTKRPKFNSTILPPLGQSVPTPEKSAKANARKETAYFCQYCRKAFTTFQGLQRHERIHTGEKPYSCNVCDKRFTVSCNLKTHMRVHTGEKPYKCTTCQGSFAQLSELKRHARSHNR